jgi:putative iron-dependent peroxidase
MTGRAQPGIFGLGNPEHCFIELDLAPAADAFTLVSRLAALTGPETTVRGVNVVVGFRPELWRSVAGAAPADAPAAGAASFAEIAGPDFTMPATQHDAWFWIAGAARDVVFDSAVSVIDSLAGVASVASELVGWVYRSDRDLTGFIDGTENPPVLDAPGVAVDGSGASVLLYQKWRHLPAWRGLDAKEQELVIGRTKADSVQLDDAVMPDDSHVSRNVVEEDGGELAIYRRNVAYGGPTDHGTVFVGFCASQRPLDTMLRRMAGADGGPRDALTRYTAPLSGAYYLVPPIDGLATFLPEEG